MTQPANGQTGIDHVKKQPDAVSSPKAADGKPPGTVTPGPFSGAVNMKDKAGTEEAQLLAARAVRMAAERIVVDVLSRTNAETFCLFPVAQAPTFQHLIGYRVRFELVREAFDTLDDPAPADDKRVPNTAEKPGATRGAGFLEPLPAVASTGLDAVVKLLDFFRTDYEIGGVDVTVDDNALLFAVAGALRRHGNPHRAGTKAVLPLTYGPQAAEAALREIMHDLKRLAQLRVDLAHRIASVQRQTGDGQTGADAHKTSLEPLQTVAALYDGFATYISTPDANGIPPIAAIAQERGIELALAHGADVLLLHLESTGGGYLIKKNLLTALGSMPLYHTGGATAIYLLVSGTDGGVLGGDIVPVYGGFIASGDLAGTLARR